jgi:hypothetical protein
VTVQQQAFQVYYSSLTTEELLKIAANRRSFVSVAQEALVRELRERNLDPGEPSPSSGNRTAGPGSNLLVRMRRMVSRMFTR